MTTDIKELEFKILVDRLGYLQATIAPLETECKEIKAQLADHFRPDPEPAEWSAVVEGHWFRSAISHFSKGLLDMKAVRAKLSRQFIAANTTMKPQDRVTCSARKGVFVPPPLQMNVATPVYTKEVDGANIHQPE